MPSNLQIFYAVASILTFTMNLTPNQHLPSEPSETRYVVIESENDHND
jgi:hypothetical protein